MLNVYEHNHGFDEIVEIGRKYTHNVIDCTIHYVFLICLFHYAILVKDSLLFLINMCYCVE